MYKGKDPFRWLLVRKHGRVLIIASIVVGLIAAGNLLQEANHLTGFSAVFMRMIIIVITMSAPLFGEIDDETTRILRTLPVSTRRVATAQWLSMCVLYPLVLGGTAIGAAFGICRDSSGCVIAGLVWTFTAATMATRTGLISGKGCLIPVAAVIALLFDIPARVEEVNAIHLAAFIAAIVSLPLSYRRRDKLIVYFMDSDDEPESEDTAGDASESEDELKIKQPPDRIVLARYNFLIGMQAGLVGAIFAGLMLLLMLYGAKEDRDFPDIYGWYMGLAIAAWYVNQSNVSESRKGGLLRALRTLPRSPKWIANVVIAGCFGCYTTITIIGTLVTAYYAGPLDHFFVWLAIMIGPTLFLIGIGCYWYDTTNWATRIALLVLPVSAAGPLVYTLFEQPISRPICVSTLSGVAGLCMIYRAFSQTSGVYRAKVGQ